MQTTAFTVPMGFQESTPEPFSVSPAIAPALAAIAPLLLDVKLPLAQVPEPFLFLQGAVEELIDGIVILTESQELVYANENAKRILEQLNQDKLDLQVLPQEIAHICQSLINSRALFPDQNWRIKSEITMSESIALQVQVRWLRLDKMAKAYLLLTLEDRYQVLKTIALEEAKRYGLTPREEEVWVLHRAHYTYKKIATKLYITPNTVKKHMRSIHAKQKEGGIFRG